MIRHDDLSCRHLLASKKRYKKGTEIATITISAGDKFRYSAASIRWYEIESINDIIKTLSGIIIGICRTFPQPIAGLP